MRAISLLCLLYCFGGISLAAEPAAQQAPAKSPPAKSPSESQGPDKATLERNALDLLRSPDEQPTSPGVPPSQLGFVRTSLFGVAAEGAKFVYVFDRSASMSEPKHRPIEAAKAELLKSIAPLGRVHQFYLIFYNQQPRLFQIGEGGKLIFGTDQNKAAAAKFIASVAPEGATGHRNALNLALKMRPDVIFLLTDGDANDDLSTADLAELEKQNGGATQIHVIQFTADLPTGENLPKLAKQNRGEFKSVPVKELLLRQ